MDRENFKNLHLGNGELFIHDDSDLKDYDQFFEFFLANGEMAGRVDALHSQHVRDGAKKDVLCVRLIDLWGERTYPIHRGRPGGRFISRLTGPDGTDLQVKDVFGYHQAVDSKTGILTTSYDWQTAAATGHNQSTGFMSKATRHLMTHRYIDTAQSQGWTRSFTIETIFPYHSRASSFYFKRPYSGREWTWGEFDHEYEIEPTPNASVGYDDHSHIGLVTFATEFEPLATQVAWCVRPATPPDRWNTNENAGSLTLEWDLTPGVEHDTTVFVSIMTDRDSADFIKRTQDETAAAYATGWDGVVTAHREWWQAELAKSSINIPDPRLQELYDISMLYMIQNVGGTYWPFIGIDNVIYETCMCDNPVMLHSLVETNHLEAAQTELELLHTYLPAARKNARDRMKVVLGIENDDAALIPFYMTEDGIELWQDNVFGMYTTQSAYHFSLLSKTASYTENEQFLRDVAYPWFRAYAEYGRLHAVWDEVRKAYIFPIQNLGGGGEGYWFSKTMSSKLYWRIFARSDPMFRFADIPPIEWMPVDEIKELDDNWLDVVINFRWILAGAAKVAGALGVDTELREEWKKVADGLLMPQDEQFYLQHIGETAKPHLGGPAVGSVFWPAEGTFEDLDPEKLVRTLSTITSTRHIEGYLRHRNRAWDALNGFDYAYTGDAEEALHYLQSFATAADHRGIEMRESIPRQNYYYLLNQGTMILLARYMMLQTYSKKICVFPAVPAEWRKRGVSFSGLPAEGGLLVDGRLGSESCDVSVRNRNGAILFELSGSFSTIRISVTDTSNVTDTLTFDLSTTDAPVTITVPSVPGSGGRVVEVDGRTLPAGMDIEAGFVVEPPTRVSIRRV